MNCEQIYTSVWCTVWCEYACVCVFSCWHTCDSSNRSRTTDLRWAVQIVYKSPGGDTGARMHTHIPLMHESSRRALVCSLDTLVCGLRAVVSATTATAPIVHQKVMSELIIRLCAFKKVWMNDECHAFVLAGGKMYTFCIETRHLHRVYMHLWY